MDVNFYYTVNGIIIHDLSEVPENSIVQKNPRLCGGKGGFGSMLRAIGSQIEKTTNREMCRDLNGRRMRDVNNEKRLNEWLEKADVREKEKLEIYLEKRRKRRILLEQGPSASVPFEEQTAEDKRKRIAEELQEAICEAFKNRKTLDSIDTELPKPKKINLLNIDSDLDSDSSSSVYSPVESTLEDVSVGKNENEIVKEPELVEQISVEASRESVNIDQEPCAKIVKINEESSVSNETTTEDIFENKPTKETTYAPIDLDQVGSVAHLLTFGPDWIKNDLMCRGLKCGGTLMERAQRLFSVKGLKIYPQHLLVGAVKGKRK